MRKLSLVLCAAVVLASACGENDSDPFGLNPKDTTEIKPPPPPPPKDTMTRKIVVSSDKVFLRPGQTLKITATPQPVVMGAYLDTKVVFSSVDPAVAEVTENGTITGHKFGYVPVMVSRDTAKTLIKVWVADTLQGSLSASLFKCPTQDEIKFVEAIDSLYFVDVPGDKFAECPPMSDYKSRMYRTFLTLARSHFNERHPTISPPFFEWYVEGVKSWSISTDGRTIAANNRIWFATPTIISKASGFYGRFWTLRALVHEAFHAITDRLHTCELNDEGFMTKDRHSEEGGAYGAEYHFFIMVMNRAAEVPGFMTYEEYRGLQSHFLSLRKNGFCTEPPPFVFLTF